VICRRKTQQSLRRKPYDGSQGGLFRTPSRMASLQVRDSMELLAASCE